MAFKKNAKTYPTNPNIDIEDLMDYVEIAFPEEHQEGCAFGLANGFGDKITECHCSKSHILNFLKKK